MNPQNPSGSLIRSSRYIGYAPASSDAGWRVIGQDGGQTVRVAQGTLFLFSDTLIATGDTVTRPGVPVTNRNGLFLANCAALSGESTLAGALANLHFYSDPLGRPRELIRATMPERVEGYRFWPQHGIDIDGRVLLFYIGIHHHDQSTTWGFEPVGTGLAIFDPVAGDCQRLWREGDWRLWNPTSGLHFGVQVLRKGDWIYAFSSRQTGSFSAAILSRVRSDSITDPSAWQHLSGAAPNWSDRLENACELAYCGPEFSVSWNEYRKQYLMTSVDGYTKTLQLRTAPEVWGPYSEPYSTGALPHRPESELLSLAFEHPTFAAKGGETIFISYCQPRFTQNSLVAITLCPNDS